MAADPGFSGLIDEGVDQGVVLDSLRAFHREFVRREQAMVLLAVQWARLNPGMERSGVGAVDGEELLWEEIAAKGCPLVEDLAVPAFADAAGLSEYQGRKLIREALVLVLLLPRVWKRAQAGQVEVWRARLLAQECWEWTPSAVEYVDRLMSLSTARHTQAGRWGVIQEARLRFMGEQVAAEQEADLEERCVQIQTPSTQGGQASTAGGVVGIWGALELPDALALEAAIARGAKALKDLGSSESLDVRRSWALGDLARTGGPSVSDPSSLFASASAAGRDLDLGGRSFLPQCACSLGLSAPGRGGGESKVMMYLHLTPDAFPAPENETTPKTEADREPSTPAPSAGEAVWDARGGGIEVSAHTGQPGSDLPPSSSSMEGSSKTAVSTSGGEPGEKGMGVVRVGGAGIGAGMAMSARVVRSWFTRPRLGPGVKVIFRPVVDLADHQHVEAYEVPERLKEHAEVGRASCRAR